MIFLAVKHHRQLSSDLNRFWYKECPKALGFGQSEHQADYRPARLQHQKTAGDAAEAGQPHTSVYSPGRFSAVMGIAIG